jgi:hypothetical protein
MSSPSVAKRRRGPKPRDGDRSLVEVCAAFDISLYQYKKHQKAGTLEKLLAHRRQRRPVISLAPCHWLAKPELPWSNKERSLRRSAPPEFEMKNGKSVKHNAHRPAPLPEDDIRPLVSLKSASGWAHERAEHAALVELAEKEEHERNEERDNATIAAGKSAWVRLKKVASARF